LDAVDVNWLHCFVFEAKQRFLFLIGKNKKSSAGFVGRAFYV